MQVDPIDTATIDVVWGARAIGQVIGLTDRQAQVLALIAQSWAAGESFVLLQNHGAVLPIVPSHDG